LSTIAFKQSIDELAIFGSKPAFLDNLHVGRPNIGDRQSLFNRINDILDRRWLTNRGIYVQEFEKRVADYTGTKHCIAVCNGTIALEMAIRALGLTGEVILPSFTFVATAHALQWHSLQPVFCDVDPHTHNIDPLAIERMITPRTSGIIGVHVWGRPCPTDKLTEIAKRNQLSLLFDAAHAFGCSNKGRMIGNFGEAEIFSFHATKFINTFEGGAIITNNDDLAAELRLIKNFGFADYDTVVRVGTNAKMNEVSAAMGLVMLENLDEIIETNYQNYQFYQSALSEIPGVHLAAYDQAEKNNYQYIVLEIDESGYGINRDLLVKILHAENILARRYFYPGCHHMEPYRSLYPQAGHFLKNTEDLTQRVLSLPTGTAVGEIEIAGICQIIKLVSENPAYVLTRLGLSWDSVLMQNRGTD
jgi:dTDP-4-amino-4,6-dideoxygalactose transaminase